MIVSHLISQVTGKKIKKYEKEYHVMKEQEMQQEDPIERYDVSRYKYQFSCMIVII